MYVCLQNDEVCETLIFIAIFLKLGVVVISKILSILYFYNRLYSESMLFVPEFLVLQRVVFCSFVWESAKFIA